MENPEDYSERNLRELLRTLEKKSMEGLAKGGGLPNRLQKRVLFKGVRGGGKKKPRKFTDVGRL